MEFVTPIVSVIIPSYQSADTLPRAIQSVLDQDFTDFEIIIVNNGSNDLTSQVILEAECRDSRVKGIHLDQNRRPAGGRNAGAMVARGELIAFLDADDEWLHEKLGTQVAILREHPDYSLVFSDSLNVYLDESKIGRQSATNALIMNQLGFIPVVGFSNAFFLSGEISKSIYTKSFINMSSTLLRKEKFWQVGGFNTDRFGTEDIDFWVRFSLKNKLIYWHQPTVRCFQGRGTSTPGEGWFRELVNYHRMCLISPDYADMRDLARANLLKIYRYLIVLYALKSTPGKAMQTFQESLDLGFNPRLATYALVSFIGPIPFRIGQWLTSRKRNPITALENLFD